MTHSKRRLDLALIFGTAAVILLPWYRIEGGFFGFSWLSSFPSDPSTAPGILEIFSFGRWWLAIAAGLFRTAPFGVVWR